MGRIARSAIMLPWLGLLALTAGAQAASGMVAVTFSGEAYDGPPKFEIRFNGSMIGSGEVSSAIDTAVEGAMAAAPNIDKYLETIDFLVPDGVFSADGALEIKFLNNAWGGEGTVLDRNLMIAKILVNGQEVSFAQITTSLNGEVQPQRDIQGMLLLWQTGVMATANAPASGWPTLAERNVTGANPATDVVDYAAVDVTPVESAAPEPNCEAASIEVTNFVRGAPTVPEGQTGALQDFAAALPPKVCAVVVTGYSSTAGEAELNKQVARARAETVLAYLTEHGAVFSKGDVVAYGETDQFGPLAVDNQRVVVSVGP